MDLLQMWMIVGIPGLVIVGALFTGRSVIRSLVGYFVLTVLLVLFLTVTGDVISTAAVGLIGFVLVATGRGTAAADGGPEHHEDRKRFTVDPSAG